MLCRRYSVDMDFVHPIAAVIPGAQGRVLEALANTTAELNLRTLARLSGVSKAQVSRVLPGLVELGLVERREVPPSSQFLLVRSHVAVRAILELGAVADTMVSEIGRAAGRMVVSPISVILFGSFARDEAGGESDLDVVLVRPADLDDDDERWASAVDRWRAEVHAMSGNAVEVLEVAEQEIAPRLLSGGPLWRDIRRDGRVVHGLSLDDLLVEPNG